MTFAELANPGILTQPVYEPGKPIETVARELGLDPAGIIKLASNENPHGPSPKALAAAQRALQEAHLYPDGGYYALREKLAQKHGLGMNQFIIGDGSNELLELLGHAFLSPGKECVMHASAFVVYKLVALMFGAKPVEVPLGPGLKQDTSALLAAITPNTRLVFLASPANPTGVVNTAEEIAALIRALPPHVILVMDEAYIEFLENPPDLRPFIAEGRKVIGLRTFSKIYGLASLRVGYGYAAPELIAIVQRARQPFNVNAIASAAAVAALDDEEFVTRCRRENIAGLAQLASGFQALGLESVPGHGNFQLVKVGDGVAVFDALQRRGVITRPVKGYGLPEWLRVTVGTPAQNERLLAELKSALQR
ncbi:histidinol-phosphate transaminase [Oleiharenicola lentus]|jgi:histidinol-phosphate aminotransferase|uniref:Histidinol-phosphate aminotransferase n=1 Tax=Oleiharenicola lentus TaxID=2508720 RepID=A0A4Q1C7B9_9BACT|nr:histidinol-phosphate transaminase [Oleiharenicola lentus]RXK54701.1 histidinol-phosphate transaminase [Oleiharenicola lentus]